MKRLKGLHLLVVLGIVIVSAGIFTPFVGAQTIHALLLIDDGNPSNFQQHQTSHTRMIISVEDRIDEHTSNRRLRSRKFYKLSGRSRISPDFPTL